MELAPLPELTTVRQQRPFQTTLGEYLRAQVGEGFWATTTGQALARQQISDADEGRVLSQEEWRSSPFFRERIPFDERMTVARARALADVYDDNEYRRFVIGARQAGAGETALGFGAALVGAVPAVENFLPIAGPAWRAAQAVRFGMRGVRTLEAALGGGVRGAAAAGAMDGFLGNALVMPFVDESRREFGDDIRFADQVLDLALGAAAGALFGGAAGLLRRWRAGPDAEPIPRAPGELDAEPPLTVREQQQALNALGHAADDLARGRSVDVGRDPRLAEVEAGLASRADPDAPLQPAGRTMATAAADAVEPPPVRATGPVAREMAESAGIDPRTRRSVEIDQAQVLAEAGRLTDPERRALAEANDVVARTERIGQAYRAAAMCALGLPARAGAMADDVASGAARSVAVVGRDPAGRVARVAIEGALPARRVFSVTRDPETGRVVGLAAESLAPGKRTMQVGGRDAAGRITKAANKE